MKQRSHCHRGAALAETAVTLSFALLTIYGAFQIGLMGYFQLQLDGATFFFTHAYASGTSQASDTSKYDTALAPLFPNVTTANISPTFQTPPDTQVPVNYTQWGTLTQRFGGLSLLRPQRLQAKATYMLSGSIWSSLLSETQHNIALSAGNVDARPVIGNHDDDAQGAGYNTSTVYNSVVDPLITDDQNVPPYYFNFAFMWECNSVAPDLNNPWSTCPGDHNPNLTSLGLAEFLKDDNYNNATDGVDQNGVFELMKCHQQIYAAISLVLQADPIRPSGSEQLAAAWDQAIGTAGLNTVNTWDVNNVQNKGGNQSNIGRQNPLHPEHGC